MSEITQQTTKPQPLSTQGYRGTRDFYPEDQRLRKWIHGKIHSVMRSFGYEEYDGPILEHLELYAAKSSQEIVQEQLFSLRDRGERLLAIRPEMTPTLARMVASRYRQLGRPIRWYSIPTLMRFERPQRGRLREFDQPNVDIFGGLAVDEDVEIILTAVEFLRFLGAKNTDFEVRINHRGLINEFLYGTLGISESLKSPLLRLLDKRDKLARDDFFAEGEKLGITADTLQKIDSFLSSDLETAGRVVGEENRGFKEIKERIEVLRELVGQESIRFSPDVMRGFDYYTGMVFEVYDTHPENRRALLGGGRYDNLVGAFGVDPLPGVGYGVGEVGITDYLRTHGLMPELKKETDVVVIRFSEADRLVSLQLAALLRAQGLNVEAPTTAAKFGKQIQAAEKSGAGVVVFRGEEEVKNNTFTAKWLRTGEQKSYSLDAPDIFKQEVLQR